MLALLANNFSSIIPTENERLSKWGSCWRRYYKLETSYYISTLGENVIRRITENTFWKQNFVADPGATTQAQGEKRKELKDVNGDVSKTASERKNTGGKSGGGKDAGEAGGAPDDESKVDESIHAKALNGVTDKVVDVTTKREIQVITDIVKEMVFGNIRYVGRAILWIFEHPVGATTWT